MNYKNGSRKKFEETFMRCYVYLGPSDFNIGSNGQYENQYVQRSWEGWFAHFQATYQPPKPKPRYHVEWLESEHECSCGDCVFTSAYGYKLFKDGELVIDKTPVSSCEKYLDFGECSVHYDICELEKIQITEETNYG